MGLSMTAADICSSHKQWEVQRFNVSVIVEEFFLQVTNYYPLIISSCFPVCLPVMRTDTSRTYAALAAYRLYVFMCPCVHYHHRHVS
jgi:hypothetical protein